MVNSTFLDSFWSDRLFAGVALCISILPVLNITPWVTIMMARTLVDMLLKSIPYGLN